VRVGEVPVDGSYEPVGLEELRENGVQDGRLTQFVVGVPVPHVDEADGVDLLHAPIDRKNTTKNEERRTKNKERRTKNKERRTKNEERRTKPSTRPPK
jgi:hypothetical protein